MQLLLWRAHVGVPPAALDAAFMAEIVGTNAAFRRLADRLTGLLILGDARGHILATTPSDAPQFLTELAGRRVASRSATHCAAACSPSAGEARTAGTP